MLSDQLEQEPQKIQVLSRALLLDDSLNLARGGLLDYGVALKLACYLQREYDFVPWQSALTNFAYLDSTLLHKPLHRAFKEYMLRLLTNVYNEVGFEESPRGENHLRRLTREIVVSWACRMGHRNCIQKSIAYVRALVTKSPRWVSFLLVFLTPF
ncbi:hypothetical protein AAG570_000429 [Ranatra chinensis]|uniref:ERAP1-like C-terminal domain-containing protein n=1 Tax=Ranatra chinensis TaxID=642074 RepID=A0ABD0Z9Q6_9HEMI